MRLGKKIAFVAATVAILGGGTLATTTQASAATTISAPALGTAHYGWNLLDLFGGQQNNDQQGQDQRDRGNHNDGPGYRGGGSREGGRGNSRDSNQGRR